MNNLLFDGIATQGTKGIVNHGGADYAKFVLRELIKKPRNFDIVFSNVLISDVSIVELVEAAEGVNIIYVNSKEELYRVINDRNYTSFYSALPYKYDDYCCKAKLIGVIHGVRDIELCWDKYKHLYFKSPIKRFLGYLISKSTFIQERLRVKHIKRMNSLLTLANAEFLTVSQHSKFALLNFFPNLDAQNIQVFYSPFDVTECREEQFSDKDYYLMVNGNRFEKNIHRAIKSFDKLFSDGRLQGKRVVITGCNGINYSNVVRNLDRFEFLPYVSYDRLEELYREAFCFVYPSLNEGFGYPPLKAMSYRVPVIASSSTSIPEVCQDAAIMFSPTSCDDLCNRILQIEYNIELRDICIKKGYARAMELHNLQGEAVEQMINYIIE